MSNDSKILNIINKENKYWNSQLKSANNFTTLFNGLKVKNNNLLVKKNQKITFNSKLEEEYTKALSKNLNITHIYLLATLCLTINKLDGRKKVGFDIPKSHGNTFETLPFLEEIRGSETIRDLLNITKEIYVNDLSNQHIDIEGLIQRKFSEFGDHRDILITDKLNTKDTQFNNKKYKLIIYIKNNEIINFETTSHYLDNQELVAFGQTYINLLKVIMNSLKRDIKISDISLVEEEYPHKDKFNFVSDIASNFEKIAFENNKIAVKFNDSKISFCDLNKKANKIANMIKTNADLSHQTFIGIMMHKSIDMIAAILGILKLHKAYVPIDPEYPTKRIEEIIKETNLKVIYAEDDNSKHINLDSQHVKIFNSKRTNNYMSNFKTVVEKSSLNLPCYIIFTSGTTGHPKPVVVTQANVLNLIANVKSLFKIDSKAKWTMFHQFSFDFSVWEIFGSLLNNNTLVIVDDETTKDSKKFLSLINKEKINVLCQTPNAFYTLIDRMKESDINLNNLKYIFLVEKY